MDILLLHGFSASSTDLKGTIKALKDKGHQVTAPELKNCTLSGQQHFSSDKWVEDAEETLLNFAASTQNDFAIAGHSLGGVLCAYLLTSSLPKQITNRISKCAFLATPAGIDRNFLDFWRTVPSHKTDWPFSLQVEMFSFLQHVDSLFSKVNIPSIVLQGGNDIHIPPSSGEKLSKMLGENCIQLSSHPAADHFFPAYGNTSSTYLHHILADFFYSTKRP